MPEVKEMVSNRRRPAEVTGPADAQRPGRVLVIERKALIGGGRKEESRQTLRVPGAAEVTALALDGRGEDLFVGTAIGQVVRYDLRDRDKPRAMEATQA